MSPETFAIRFKEARERKNITIKALQPIVGASPSAMSGYATGKTLPSLDVAAKIAKELDVSLDWLCGNKDEEESGIQIRTCADAAIALDRVVDRFEEATIEPYTDEGNDGFTRNVYYFVDIRIESKALYDYFSQLETTREYLKNLPDNMRDGFIPYKKAMEKQLQKRLAALSEEEAGFRVPPRSSF